MNMIKAIELTKTYFQGKAKVEALKDIHMEVPRGSSVVITGPSGAGKSTLLHIIGGLDKPTKGVILFEGLNLYALSDRERSNIRNERIGFVFQFYHLLPEFTVSENVMLPALIKRHRTQYSVKNIRKRAEHLLLLVGLEKRKAHRPSELSGGESQRAAIARSLINSPEVLLCDEPTGNLDSRIGQEVMDCLWTLKVKSNMTLIMVTHDESMHIGFDKSYRIKDGSLEEFNYGSQDSPKWEVCR